jgi:hypothetical protein
MARGTAADDPLHAEAAGGQPAHSQADELVSQALTGDVPCVRCRYQLRGLSIVGNCPECGTPIKTTILFTVDPHAPQLRPMPKPGLVGIALAMTTGGGLLAGIFLVLPWLVALAQYLFQLVAAPPSSGLLLAVHRNSMWLAAIAIGVSAAGTLLLYRPVRPTPDRCRLGVLASMIGYVLIVVSLLRGHAIHALLGFPSAFTPPALANVDMDVERLAMRMAFDLGMAIAFISIRPVARLIVFRSLALRTGRVARQTLYPMAAAAGAAFVGDSMQLLAAWLRTPLTVGPTVLGISGEIIVWCASAFVLIGLFRSVVDALRIRSSLVTPSPSLNDLLAPRPG